MTQLTTLPATASTKDILAVIHQDGAVVVRDLIASSEVDRVLDETRPYIDATRTGADEFSGFKTTRTGALVARSPVPPGDGGAPRRERVRFHLNSVDETPDLGADHETYLRALSVDKKVRDGKLGFVVLRDIGRAEVLGLTPQEILEVQA